MAISGEGIKGIRTLGNVRGIKTTLTIPWTYGSKDAQGNDATNYFDYYLGLGSTDPTYHGWESRTDVEAGVFYYTKKGWVIFLNFAAYSTSGGYWNEQAISVTPGSAHTMELHNNGNGTASFYWDGSLKWTASIASWMNPLDRLPATEGFAKVVHGKVNSSGNMFYSGATTGNLEITTSSRNSYSSWSDTAHGYAHVDKLDGTGFTVTNRFPLSTNLA